MTIATRPLAEINQSAMRLLCHEIGIVNTARFINQFSTGYGNYTEEREDIFGEITVDEIVAQITKLR